MTYPCLDCGKPRDRIVKSTGVPASLCRACHNAAARAKRKKYSELSPEQKLKAKARCYAKEYKRRGKLVPKPCERCSAPAADTQMHHADYSKPLQVQWLCAKCHLALHSDEQPAVVAAKGPVTVRRGSWLERWFTSAHAAGQP